ncbi:MAG: histone-like nucleoid-structuring protein Lsr2, partial [Umezawaea sp.]
GTGLSLVLGPNETGKSTALDALADLLWSIPPQSKRAFHFRRHELAVKAVLVLPDGSEIPVERTAAGLVDSDTRADVTAVWQGSGDDRGSWRTSFGLTHEELRRGGRDLFEAKGDLAALIFRARSGQSVHHLLDSLSVRSDLIYKEHRGNKSVRARRALVEYEQAVRDVEEATALATDVANVRKVLLQAEEDSARTGAAKDRAAAELADRQARLRVVGDVRRLAAAEARIAELRSAGPFLVDADLDLHAGAVERLAEAALGIAAVEGEITATEAALASAGSDDPVLADRARIEHLARESAARLEDAENASAAGADAERIRAEVRSLLVDLAGPGDLSADALLDALWVGEDRIAELDATAAALTEADEVVAGCRRAVDAAGDRESGGSGTDAPDAHAVEVVRDAVTAIEADDSVVVLFRRTSEVEAQARQDHVRLLASAGLPAHTSVGALPSPESVRSALDELRRREAEAVAAGGALEDLEDRVAGIERELSGSDLHEIPDPTAVTTARDARDHLIAEALRAWLAGEPPSRAPDLPVRVDRAVREADRVGDLAAKHGEATAQRGVLTGHLRAERAEALLAQAAVTAADLAEEQARRTWEAMWEPTGVPCPPPAGAVAFRDLLGEALAAEAQAAAAHRTAEGLRPEVGQRRDYLARLLDQANRPRPDADLDSLLVAAKQLLADDDEARESRARRQQLRQLRDEAEQELQRANGQRDEVVVRWQKALETSGLPDLTPVEWYRRRDVLVRARAAHTEANGLGDRARTSASRHQEFVDELATLVGRLGIDVDVDADTEGALDTLSQRLHTAHESAVTARNLRAALDSLSSKLDGFEEQRRLAAGDLDALRDRSGTEDLDGAAERGLELAELAEGVRRHTDVVRAALPKADPAELVVELAGIGEEELRIAVDTARLRSGTTTQEHNEALLLHGKHTQRHEALVNRPGAAELHAKAQERLAVLAEEVEEYLVAELQRSVLREELEAYERKHASPLLETAGRFLEELTEGRYVALQTRNDTGGRSLRIVGADGESRRPDELSEGTADQAFLALRLAGIESMQQSRRSAGLPTLPVVLDDVLMTFDDTRAAAALRVMARLADQWQIVVFSHHTHIHDVAEDLGLDNLTVSRLPSPEPIDSTRTPQEVRDAARETAAIGTGPPSAPRTTAPVDRTAVREWARRNGRPVGDRGRIPQDILDAYDAAHG